MDGRAQLPTFRDDSAVELPALTRSRFAFRRRSAPGAPPGQVLPDPDALPPELSVFAYDAERVVERKIERLEELDDLCGHYPVVWLNIDGLGNAQLLRAIGERFGIHALALEDVVNVHQRAKVEVYGQHLFAVIRAVSEDERWVGEQVSLFLGKDFVLTFQEIPGDSFEPVRQRIRDQSGRMRAHGPDYLLYALLDSVVDRYFPSLEEYGERLEQVERDLFSGFTRGLASRIHAIKWDLLTVRHAIWPLREALRVLMHDTSGLIREDTRLYLRDTADHVGQLIDLVESYREMSGGMLESHLALSSNRMSEVMKVLTMVATIFIPLSFVAGVYGMNFDPDASALNMPETRWTFGYPFALLLMLGIGLGMLSYFKRKGWLRRDD